MLVRVRDHWRLGDVDARVCLRRKCRTARIKPGRSTRNIWLRARGAGIRTVTATAPWGQRARRVVELRRRPVTVLATGDSMIQIVDSFLKRRLGRVHSDARISTGISKPAMFDWVRHARRQRARRADVTVMFIGANDGFPIGDAQCCGEAWVAAYARRVRSMMAAYKRGRKGVVYWLTLPTPRSGSFARVFGPVNRAIVRAARSFRGNQVRVIDLRRTFTPGGRYRRTIRYRGKTVVARQGDGVHLSTAGASIAASLVIRAMRRDRIRG
jgi:hypothetical protein